MFVSESPQETEEEEEEHDEEISIDGLDDVEMTIATLSWRKTKSERCWRRRGNTK